MIENKQDSAHSVHLTVSLRYQFFIYLFFKSAQKTVCLPLRALLASSGFLCVPLGVFVCAHWLTFEKERQESTCVCLMLWLFVDLPRSCNSNPCMHLFVLAYNRARVCKLHGY